MHVTPIQATLIGYFYPESSLSPFLLVGAGWYLTHADGPYAGTQRRFGPHAGAGLELLLGGHWSLDASYRFLWTQIMTLSKPHQFFSSEFSERGSMLTVGLNYRL